MNSLFDKNRYKLKQDITRNNRCYSEEYNDLFSTTDENAFLDNFYKYFKKGKFMISFRENVVFALKRNFFSRIYSLGVTYGLNDTVLDQYWFNSESQLVAKCIDNDIDIFESVTKKEGSSLYSYKTKVFFESEDESKLREDNDDVFFFLMRH
jgi:hypothetical protein